MTEFVKKHFNYRDISKGLSERDCLKVIMDLSLDGSITNIFFSSANGSVNLTYLE